MLCDSTNKSGLCREKKIAMAPRSDIHKHDERSKFFFSISFYFFVLNTDKNSAHNTPLPKLSQSILIIYKTRKIIASNANNNNNHHMITYEQQSSIIDIIFVKACFEYSTNKQSEIFPLKHIPNDSVFRTKSKWANCFLLDCAIHH